MMTRIGILSDTHGWLDEQIYTQCLHINPGAAGKQGWHKARTIVRLTIDGNKMKDCEVIEL